MSKRIINSVSKAAELDDKEPFQKTNLSEERPTVADLVRPGAGYKFSDEFACFLKILGRESA